MTNISKITKRTKSSSAAKDGQEKDNSNKKNSEETKGLCFGKIPKFPYQRVWSRAVLILGVLIVVWYSSKDGKEVKLASQKEVLQRRGHSFECDKDYLGEIANFPGCVPRKCGRYVSDKIVTANEADALLTIAKKGIALGGSDGGASILDLHSGALSYGKEFVNVFSVNPDKKVFKPADLAIYKVVKSKIQLAIADVFGLDHNYLYLTHPTFFSKLTNAEPRTEHDRYWHAHVDKVTYESFHYTSLLYLSDYAVDFKGGRLVFLDGPLDNPTHNVTLEPRRGRVAMFTSGAENMHYVERVTSGVRYAITVSFTCDSGQSISDPVEQ